MTRWTLPCLVFLLLGLPGARATAAPQNGQRLDLSGTWRLRLDPRDVGVLEEWFAELLPQRVQLPGSLQAQGFGDPPGPETPWTGGIRQEEWSQPRYAPYRAGEGFKMPFWLQPERYYAGAAWYQREVTLPVDWAGKRIVLFLERCHWRTTVWVDGEEVGTRDSLATPHEYDLTAALAPGADGGARHVLTILVDNRVLLPVGLDAHSVSDHTQSNWNGIVGKLELRATDPVWIEDLQVFPASDGKSARVKVTMGNATGRAGSGTLYVGADGYNGAGGSVAPQEERLISFGSGQREERELELELRPGSGSPAWDEFHPALFRLSATLEASNREERYFDTRTVTFGLRNISTKGTRFVLNGRPIQLRGTLECCIFPATGYPPTDVTEWKRILGVCREHGLNHLRFHSWCPPEAAFVAADELGFYFQVEGPFWTTVGNGGPIDEYIRVECDRIRRTYGNHPSFLLLAYGNEPGGANQQRFLGELVEHWKQTDSRHLYTSASGWPMIPENQFHVTPRPRIQQWGEGLGSRINARPPETMTDYREFAAAQDVPVISHEIGQWCVFPDLTEPRKYSGLLKPRNFEVFRDFLEANHLGDRARDFLMASGKLQTLCYKEEIESALRTPGFGGFQLLDLHDFPGQGTALVGVLDPFWDSKPYVTPEEFRRFCGETVLLARLEKRVFTTEESFAATVEISHFGAEELPGTSVSCELLDEDGRWLSRSGLGCGPVPTGTLKRLGKITAPLKSVERATKLRFVVSLEGTGPEGVELQNDWEIWVYPPVRGEAPPEEVLVTRELDDAALERLRAGGKVLLTLESSRVKTDAVLGFSPVFWNTAWTSNQPPHTLGILCDPEHPALELFPTEYHSNWQWSELIRGASAMTLDSLPAELEPIVQVIDTWFRSRRLALAFEARVLGGKLLVTSIDLVSDLERRPVARQLRSSFLKYYMRGPRFAPTTTLTVEELKTLFREPSLLERLGATASADDHQRGFEPELAIDGDPETIWHTSWDPVTPHPHHLLLDLQRPVALAGLRVLPRQDLTNGRIAGYEIRVGEGPEVLGEPVAAGTWNPDGAWKTARFAKPVMGRNLKLVALGEVNGNGFTSVAEVELLLE